MSGLDLTIDGLDELTTSLEKFARKNPEKAAQVLVKQARELRKDVVRQVKKETDSPVKSKQSLAKVGSYRISKVKGDDVLKYVEISARSKHFHLVENGHMQVVPRTRNFKDASGKVVKTVNVPNGGATTGFTLGYHFMDTAAEKRRIKIPEEVSNMVDKLLREEGLT